MYLGQIQTILYACKKFTTHDLDLYQLAQVLDEPTGQLHALFSFNGIIEINGTLNPWINYQDVVNTILMYYALKPYHQFMKTVFPPPKRGLPKKPRKVSEHTKTITPP